MLSRRLLVVLAVGVALAATPFAIAKNSHHHNGHALLGAKLHQDGKHALGKLGKRTVHAEVKGHKVISMSADDLQPRRVKTNKKMVSLDGQRYASNGDFQIAQGDISYGYCFDDGTSEDCYWFTADDVLVAETWYDYAG